METWIDSKQKYKGTIISLRVGNVRLDDGSMTQREVVEHSGGVAIIPIIDKAIILVRQFRITIGREIVELPAGRLEAGESPEVCARRELEEELGYRGGNLILLASYYSSVGFTNEKMHIFIASDLRIAKRRPEWDERIQMVAVPVKEIEARLLNGEFEDSKTLIGLMGLMTYLKKHPDLLEA